MKVVFLLEEDACSLSGGTDRVTLSVAGSLSCRGVSCDLAFCRGGLKSESSFPGERFPIARLFEGSLSEYDIVVSNLSDTKIKRKYLRKLFELSRDCSVKIISCHHQMPGEDILGTSFRNALYHLFDRGNFLRQLKLLVLSIVPTSLIMFFYRGRIQDKYRFVYDNSDMIVLHTEEVCRSFSWYCGLKCVDGKFAAIPNMLSFNSFFSTDELSAKKKEVLIVARMEERQKRISRALKIWKCISDNPAFEAWHLNIVGDGPDLSYYVKLSACLGIDTRVSFCGRTSPDEYYRRASIFMMTSAFEAWGLTLTESQQMGCVPVAFNSYPSLGAIINDGYNGLIVQNDSDESFVDKLESLMLNDHYRFSLAENAIVSSHRFESDKVGNMWISLFKKII